MIDVRTLGIQRILAVLALLSAIGAAYNKGDLLAYAGIAFYLVCIAALLLKHIRAGLLLWAAVGVHFGLVSYSLWRWQALGTVPCHFCFLAAGSALLAAVVYYRPRLALAPLALMILAGYSWSNLFQTPETSNFKALGVETSVPVQPTGPVDQQSTINPSEASGEKLNESTPAPEPSAVRAASQATVSIPAIQNSEILETEKVDDETLGNEKVAPPADADPTITPGTKTESKDGG